MQLKLCIIYAMQDYDIQKLFSSNLLLMIPLIGLPFHLCGNNLYALITNHITFNKTQIAYLHSV